MSASGAETYIRRQLDGHFYRMKHDSYGHVMVEDVQVAADFMPNYRTPTVTVARQEALKREPWTDQRVEIVLELRELGVSWFDIAVRFGVHPKSCRKAVERYLNKRSGAGS